MSKQIKETPLLIGRDAEKFARDLKANQDNVLNEDELKSFRVEQTRRQENFKKLLQISEFH